MNENIPGRFAAMIIALAFVSFGLVVWHDDGPKIWLMTYPLRAPHIVVPSRPVKTTLTPLAKATTSLNFPPSLNWPSGASPTGTVVMMGYVESSTAPLTSLLADPGFPASLASEAFIKVSVIATSTSDFFWPSWIGKELDIVGNASYLDGFALRPGDIIRMSIASCALYPTWPNFTCVSQVTLPVVHSTGIMEGVLPTWSGQNDATITLKGVSVDVFPSSSILSLSLAIASGYGDFCPSSVIPFGLGIIRDEYGDLIHPAPTMDTSTAQCVGFDTTTTQMVFWPAFPTSSSPIIIGAFDASGKQQTFFSINVLPNQVMYIDPAPTQ